MHMVAIRDTAASAGTGQGGPMAKLCQAKGLRGDRDRLRFKMDMRPMRLEWSL